MGCFNSSGFISKLPIKYGDRVVCFFGVIRHDTDGLYYPDSMVAPYFLPIRGEYNDYGGIENIDNTHIVKIIEKVAGHPIERILEGVERSSVYGRSIEDGIRYWQRAKKEMLKDHEDDEDAKRYADGYEEDIKTYKCALDLFKGNRFEGLMEMMADHGIDYPVDERDLEHSVVLLFEHESVYDKITQDFGEPAYLDKLWGTPSDRFDEFMGIMGKIRCLDEETKSNYENYVPCPTGCYGDWAITDLMFDGEDKMRKALSRLPLFGDSSCPSLEMFDKLSDDERLEIYEKVGDELRRFVILYTKFNRMPMFFSLSQTAGMQNYNYSFIKEVYDACYEKLNADIADDILAEDDYDPTEDDSDYTAGEGEGPINGGGA